MIPVETAIRGWIEPTRSKRSSKPHRKGWRSAGFDDRVLVFDTETTIDHTQRLLFGFFRLYVNGRLEREGVIVADDLPAVDRVVVLAFTSREQLEVLTREAFVDEVFYPELYGRGTLCVGFNLPFDLSRIAIWTGFGRGKNRRAFSLRLSARKRPRVRIEAASARAAFIRFAPLNHLADWEKPFFEGRFLDLSSLNAAFTDGRMSLADACDHWQTAERKSERPSLGIVNPKTLAYGRQDVAATYALYCKLRDEYLRHPFASMENEYDRDEQRLPITQIYSTASVAKAYLRLIGFKPRLRKQPDLSRRLLGRAWAAYFGGRAEVRVRHVDVPVRVVDFTSMYPTVFILQGLQKLLAAKRLRQRSCTEEVRELLECVELDDLYDPNTWGQLCRLVEVQPDGDILPTRFRAPGNEEGVPYSIAVSPLTSDRPRWYFLADVIGGRLLSGKVPKIRRAIAIEPEDLDADLRSVALRGSVELDPADEIFKRVVEERQRLKPLDPVLAKVLKIFANSGSYGIFAEVNVSPKKADGTEAGRVYADRVFTCADIGDEKLGAFADPILAGAITAGARLLLAMAEAEVLARGGTFAFCDTDSLAIVCGTKASNEVPCIRPKDVQEIVTKFNRLLPYDPNVVKDLLKVEYASEPELRCFAISAKRYALYAKRRGKLHILKASESGLGGIIGRSVDEKTPQLARAIWQALLERELLRRPVDLAQLGFRVPLRRKIPISSPQILNSGGFREYNSKRPYAAQIKPFGFLQATTAALETAQIIRRPVAPFEADARKSRKLPWMDLDSGLPVALDWDGGGYADAAMVLRLDEYIEQYMRHPEAKGADANGQPATSETRGLLHRLHLFAAETVVIGKEVDRLEEEDAAALSGGKAATYRSGPRPEAMVSASVAYLSGFRQASVAADLGMSERRWRDIVKGCARPRRRLKQKLIRLADTYRREAVRL